MISFSPENLSSSREVSPHSTEQAMSRTAAVGDPLLKRHLKVKKRQSVNS